MIFYSPNTMKYPKDHKPSGVEVLILFIAFVLILNLVIKVISL